MQRQCPDCFGHKTIQIMDGYGPARYSMNCRTCRGTGFVTSKRPHKRAGRGKPTIRHTAPDYIRKRREQDGQDRKDRIAIGNRFR